jgi:indole-3-glycerol phosphate synthase
MNILDKIVLNKKAEVKEAKENTTVKELEASALFSRDTYSFKEFLARPGAYRHYCRV